MFKQNKISIARFLVQFAYLVLFIANIIPHKLFFTLVMITATLLGPIFCGWLCVFGALQDALRYIGKLIKKEPIQIQENIEKYLKYSRYLILLGSTVFGGIFLFPDAIPETYRHLLKGNIEVNIALYFLALLAILSLFSERFFCRYLCSYGAHLGLHSLIRFITINKKESCTSCKLCSKSCPMNIQVDKIKKSLINLNCINCLKCLENCPSNSLNIGIRKQLLP